MTTPRSELIEKVAAAIYESPSTVDPGHQPKPWPPSHPDDAQTMRDYATAAVAALLEGVDVYDVELLRAERDTARARVAQLEAVAAVLEKVEKEQPRDIDGMLYTIPWAKAIVAAVNRVDTDAALREVRAKAIEDFYDGLELPGTDATGYYSSEQQSGYDEAARHIDTRLHAHAAAIREG